MSAIDISSYYNIGDTVKVLASGVERIGKIDQITSTALVLIVEGNDRPVFITTKGIETIELAQASEKGSALSGDSGNPVQKPAEPENNNPEHSLQAWYERMEKESSVFSSYSSFDFNSASSLVMDRKEKIDPRTHTELLQMLQAINYAQNMHETDDKFGRLQPHARKILELYHQNKAPKEILLIYTFLCRIRSAESSNQASLFTDGIATTNRYNVEISEMALAMDGSIPDALKLWKHYIFKPEVLIYIITNGFRSAREKFGILKLIRDVSQSSKPATISSINGIFYALLKTINPKMALEFAGFQQESNHTKEELLKALEAAFSKIAIQGFAYIHVTKTGKSYHLITDDLDVFGFDRSDGSSLHAGDYFNLLVDSETMEAKIAEFKSHEFTQQEYQSFIDKFLAQREVVLTLNNKRLLFDSKITLRSPASQNYPVDPANNQKTLLYSRQNNDYASLQRSKVKATTTKECLQVIEGLISIAKNAKHPKQLTAVKDILEIYGRKFMSEHVGDALSIIEEYDKIFSGEERIPFVRMCIPIFVKTERYDQAIASINYIQKISPNVININSIAWCYYKKRDFHNAILFARKVTEYPIISPTVGAAYPTLIYSYLNIGDVESAENFFAEYIARLPNSVGIADVRATIESVKQGRLNPEESTIQLDTQLEAENYIPDLTAFSVAEFTTKYLKHLLDECEFIGIRDVTVGKDGKNYYDPGSAKEALAKSRQIARAKETYMTDAQGDQKAVSHRNLTIAWLAQYCLSSEDANEDQIKVASKYFFTHSAKMLIAKARSIMKGAAVEVDFLRMIFSECIILLARMQTISLDESKENLFLNVPEFYTAFNAYVLFSVSKELGNNSSMIFWRSKIENDKSESYEQFNNKRKNDLSTKTVTNFRKAWNLSPTSPYLLSKAFVQVLSDAGDVSEYLKPFLCELISKFKLDNDFVSILESFSDSPINSWAKGSIDVVLEHSVRDFNSYQQRLVFSLGQAIDNLINNQDPEQVRTVVWDLKSKLGNPFLRTRDKTVLEEVSDTLLAVCEMFDEDIYDTARASAERNLQKINQLRTEILANPTSLSFSDVLPRIDALINYLSSHIEKLIQKHLPEIEVSDDQADEGYSPADDASIVVQLRISNADRKTTPSDITFKFFQNDETRLYYFIDENPLYTEFSLPGGESQIVPVRLRLTNLGKTPGSPMDLSFTVSYKTVQNQILETEAKVITIKTQSVDGYHKIDPIPYKVGSELRPGEDDAIFFGRERDIDIISNMLARGHSQGTSIAIYGQFRCGKTSLKNYVISKIKSKDQYVIVANLEIDESGNLSDFVYSLIHQICRSTKGKIDDEKHKKLNEYDDVSNEMLKLKPADFLCDFLELLKEEIKPFHMLVTIDEFGRIFSGNMPGNFMQYWKQIMSIGSIDAIVVGHDVLTQQMRENRNEFAAFSLHQLNYLPEDSAIRLIQNPIRSKTIGNRFKQDAVKYIYELTAGNAFYIQHICFQVVASMNDERLNKVNANQVKVIIKKWFDTDNETLNLLFHPLFMSGERGDDPVSDDDAKNILKAIARASERTNGLALKKDVINEAVEIDASLSEERINRILESLESRWVIDKHDSEEYEIRVKLYQNYLLGKI